MVRGLFVTQSPPRTLEERHLRMLRDDSAIPEEMIAERGYFTVTDAAEVRSWGFSEAQAIVPALAIPAYDVTGKLGGYVIRPDHPRSDKAKPEKVIKYEKPALTSAFLDVPKRCQPKLRLPDEPLWFTEGARKVDALAGRGITAVSLNGVYGWRAAGANGGTAVLGDFESIALNERPVVIAFDSDIATNDKVAYAAHRFALFLMSRKAHVRVLYLPDTEDGRKQGVDDYLAAGHSVEELNACIRAKVEYITPKRATDGKPNIVVNNREHAEIVDEVWQAVLEQEEQTRRVFVRNETMVRIAATDTGLLSIAEIGLDEWIGYIERAAHAVTFTARGSVVPAGFSQKIARDMLVSWKKPPALPRLAGIAEAPFFGHDGQLVSQHGYDPATGTFLNLPPNLRGLSVPSVPTKAQVEAAVAAWMDVLWDFPFVTPADRVNAIAYGLTPFVRALFDDVSPLGFITATTRGSGKGLLANVLNIPATGREIRCQAMPWRNEEEIDKRLISLLHGGVASVHFDNVEGKIDSPILASFLTALEYSGRVLGSTNSVSWPQRITSYMSGNNIMLGGDIPRRVAPIRLAPDVEHPDLRPPESFRHPSLVRYMKAHRREMVLASLTLIQHWIASGMEPGKETMGSFEKWAGTMGGILAAAGLEGFLENRTELLATADVDTSGWHAVVEAWWATYGETPVTTTELDTIVREMDDSPIPIRNKDENDRARRTALGKALGRQRDRVFLDRRIEQVGVDSHTKKPLWRLKMLQRTANPESVRYVAVLAPADPRNGNGMTPFLNRPENVPQRTASTANLDPCEDDGCERDHWRWGDGTVRHEVERAITSGDDR